MPRIKKLRVFHFGVFQGALAAALGFGCGVLYSVGGLIHDLLTTGINHGTWLAFGALWGMPIIFAMYGFFFGLIEAVLYNFWAKQSGGWKIDFIKS